MDISIVIRCFNESKFIGRLLEKIEQQETSLSYEVVVVDSGSTDGTLDIVSKHNAKVVNLAPEDFTFGHSLNLGIEASRGKYCYIISAHCIPCGNDWLEQMFLPFRTDESVGIVYGKQIGAETTQFSEHQIFAKWYPEKSVSNSKIAFCNNANSAIKKHLWYTYKFDEKLTGLEDLDWAKKIRSKGYKIAYSAEANVFHIHEEKPTQVYNRYYREALAYKEIYPNQHFGIKDFFKFLILNIFNDLQVATKDNVLLKQFYSIVVFRFLQFWGTYKAHKNKKPISKHFKRHLYYPPMKQKYLGIPENIENESVNISNGSSLIDITRELYPEMPVWPGAKPFNHEVKKSIPENACNESSFSMNIHTGTHMDAPFHFFNNGKRMRDINLNTLIGECFVLEVKTDSNQIEFEHVKQSLPHGCERLLLKTPNSIESADSFNENFFAITSNAAKELSTTSVKLIGIDGPSIQLFHDKNNKTHECLLEKEIIVIENLQLKNVEQGWYNLFALPLKIDNAEGAPLRAVLEKRV